MLEKHSSGVPQVNGGFFVVEPDVIERIDGDSSVWESDVLPALAAVLGSEQPLGGVVDHLGIVGRDQDRGGPLEAVAQVAGAPSVDAAPADLTPIVRAEPLAEADTIVLDGPLDEPVWRRSKVSSGASRT